MPAIATAIRAFTGPGDGVAIIPPVYHPFRQMVEKKRRTVHEAPLKVVDGRYEIDFDALDAAAASSRLLVLCSPHNPVGRVWTRDELLDIAEIAERRNLVVLADEIHADLVFQPNRHVPSTMLSEAFNKRLISTWAPSKTFNIAGLQVSYIVVPDQGLRKAFADETEATGIGTPNCLGVAAAEAAYRYGGPWLDAGVRFGSGGEGFARLNFGCPRPVIDEAIACLSQAF